ncbi:endonuclease/exonuclease/phosphatase family protein [Paenibacillus silvisoli]|uniref:endonuclease/exonuclease/phosphatase family protein n=1 Tax=Paenibacillus silvisoli TaxID=3110539 RepID=UPI0028063398|nr:endonuclease/exonuclease/phosphatase family protein [Paenibacillus silvisoli]
MGIRMKDVSSLTRNDVSPVTMNDVPVITTNDVSFLTWNIYRGADITPLAVITPNSVTQVFRQFLATNFPVRAQAIAREIALTKPDLIGLQEADKWVLNIPGFSIVTYDQIQILLDALKEIGLIYEVAALNENTNVQNLPDSNGNTISIFDRDAILIRKDSKLTVIRSQSANFSARFPPFIRGWSAVDASVNGHVFRMITTHLEPLDPSIRLAQTLELINGPANTDLPLILSGDLNSPPNIPVLNVPYTTLINAGFRDAWSERGAGNGFTAVQGADLLNAASNLFTRIDYILFKNGWNPIKAELTGESQSDRTSTGLWPSDHAGVFATLNL